MIILKAILMLLLPFYRVDISIPEYPEYVIYKTYNNGSVVFQTKINYNDAAYVKLREKIKTEKHGWKYDLNTYSPHQIFSAPGLEINCTKGIIVINLEQNSKPIQLSKPVQTSCPTPKALSETDSKKMAADWMRRASREPSFTGLRLDPIRLPLQR